MNEQMYQDIIQVCEILCYFKIDKKRLIETISKMTGSVKVNRYIFDHFL